MPYMKVQKTRLQTDTIQKLEEIVAADKKAHPYSHKTKAELIRNATEELVGKLWKAPLFTDQPARPIGEPKKAGPRKPRKVDHKTTPAARAYARKYKLGNARMPKRRRVHA